MKYETTRPVREKPKSAPARRNYMKKVNFVDKKPVLVTQTDIINSTNGSGRSGHNLTDSEDNSSPSRDMGYENSFVGNRNTPAPDLEHENVDDWEASQSKPPLAVRVKSASIRRPAFIDEFANDELQMKGMENDFKRTAVSLQKRLGIEDRGVVFYD